VMLAPLLGEAIARRWPTRRRIRRAVIATGLLVVLGLGLFASTVRFDWLAPLIPDFPSGRDPTIAAVDWTSLRTELASRGLLDRPDLVVAATHWHDAGKIDYALGGRVPVLCLGRDPREYGIIAPVADYAGSDVLIIAPRATLVEIATRFGDLFQSIEALPPATVLHDGRPALSLPLYLGHRLRRVGAGP